MDRTRVEHGGWGLIDPLLLVLVPVGIIALFAFDVSAPRGEVDGVGYAAFVALSSRFGKTPLLVAAAATTVLTVAAAPFLPDAGISISGMWANRFCALASIWIVAFVMHRRMRLQERIEARQAQLRKYQAALARMARESMRAELD